MKAEFVRWDWSNKLMPLAVVVWFCFEVEIHGTRHPFRIVSTITPEDATPSFPPIRRMINSIFLDEADLKRHPELKAMTVRVTLPRGEVSAIPLKSSELDQRIPVCDDIDFSGMIDTAGKPTFSVDFETHFD